MTRHPTSSPKPSYWKTPVRAYTKSIVFGADTLFPVAPDDVKRHAKTLEKVIRAAEQRAYEAGVRDAQLAARKALGLAS